MEAVAAIASSISDSCTPVQRLPRCGCFGGRISLAAAGAAAQFARGDHVKYYAISAARLRGGDHVDAAPTVGAARCAAAAPPRLAPTRRGFRLLLFLS
jgi:hypothetical protein